LFYLSITEVAGYGRMTVLEAPHRLYDAIFRDSTLDGTPFRQSLLGRQLLDARPQRATALYQSCPLVLLLGGWDAHGGEVVYLSSADKYHRLPRRLSKGQKGPDERALMASQRPSEPW
jgi:CRISPR-associated protein GSU0053 (Cas_GSU0053)